MHNLPWEVLRHGEPDNVGRRGCVGNDPADRNYAPGHRAFWRGLTRDTGRQGCGSRSLV
jgi:hypothetical protein